MILLGGVVVEGRRVKLNSYEIGARRRWLNVARIAIEDAGRGQDPPRLGGNCEPREEVEKIRTRGERHEVLGL